MLRSTLLAVLCLLVFPLQATALPAAPKAKLAPIHVEAGKGGKAGRLVDSRGREVLLRGVNVNSFAEYAKASDLPPTLPFTNSDPREIKSFGWNVVRLLITWSRVEPSPGKYDDGYLKAVRAAVDKLAAAGIYTIVDMHQDAWGPTLAASGSEICPSGQGKAIGWDGAPAWATFDAGAARCTPAGSRELSPAVREAWKAFWRNDKGPGAVGLQNRFAAMWGHVAGLFAGRDSVAGYDLLNEPNAFGDSEQAALPGFYSRTIKAVRAAEKKARAPRRVIIIEPSIVWSVAGQGPPPKFAAGSDVAYGPHLYTGVFGGEGPPQAASFDAAAREAGALGGFAVVSGEWGADASRAAAPGRYFRAHQQQQDRIRASAVLWLWKASCGDPHQVRDYLARGQAEVWSPFRTDCATNTVQPRTGAGGEQAGELRWSYPLASPGKLEKTLFDPATGVFEASGTAPRTLRAELVVFRPSAAGSGASIKVVGLTSAKRYSVPGGIWIVARSTGGRWSINVKG